MQAFGVIDIFNELFQIGLGLLKGAIVFEVDFFVLESFEETFGLGIVVTIARCRHADQSLCLAESLNIEIDPFLRRTRRFGLTHQLFVDNGTLRAQ
jgi:hypothetical protein